MRIWMFIATVLLLTACRKDEVRQATDPHEEILSLHPKHFPLPDYPEDNLPTSHRLELGEKLFFDTRLSADGTISCASCHLPELAFCDGEKVSRGIDGRKGDRNSPSLLNMAYHDRFMADGGVPSLELQVLAPIHDKNEMDFDILEIVDMLESDEEVQKLSRLAYNRDLDNYVITRAIAAYERSLFSGASAYDKYILGDKNALSNDAKLGMELFFSEKTNCSSCHEGITFRNHEFVNVGLYGEYNDWGRERITLSEADRGKFKTPSLRNVALTAPYMHDGSIESLDDVLKFFNEGGKAHRNKDSRIQKLNLSPHELAYLKAFLESLSDEQYK